MRHVALLFAILGGCALTFVSGRYGYKLGKDPIDALTWGFLYGGTTLGGLYGHALALRSWRHDRLAGGFIFLVAAMATIISLSNSLGSRAALESDTSASKVKVSGDVGRWTEALNDKKAERDKLRKGVISKRSRNRLAELDTGIEELSKKLDGAGPAVEANPLGAALTRLFNVGKEEAEKLSTWQNLAMAAVVELMIAAAMIGYEVLTHAHHEAQSRLPASRVPAVAVPLRTSKPRLAGRAPDDEEIEADELPPLVATSKPRLISSQSEPFGSVFSICADILEAGQGRLDFRDLRAAYVKACQRQGKKPVDGQRFAEDVKRMCEATGIKIQVKGDQVYLLGVRLKVSEERELEGEAS